MLFKKEKCNLILSSLLGEDDDLKDRWWRSKNRFFNMESPQEVFDKDPDKVLNYLISYIE